MPRRKDIVVVDQLETAIFNLLKEKEYKDISISELCDKAWVSRCTFYRNYRDMDDIIYQYFMRKSKKWWDENAPQVLYRYDYVVALIAHSFSWSLFVTLPVVIYSSCVVSEPLVFVFVLNMIIHALVDDLKANKLKINLALDQTVHILQIVIVWLLFV